MAKKKIMRPKARKPRGFRDIYGAAVTARQAMLEKIRNVYESYGFDPLETPAFEYADCLGKFLPDKDRPEGGVFPLQDDDDQWMALRYDLTAPTARFVAENFQDLPKPFRRYQTGPVYRNEKPGPGRFREFFQFDVDTIGTPSMAADAELCMVLCDSLEKLGIERGDYIVRVNNRKILNGVLETIGAAGEGEEEVERRMTILRAIDKLDRLGPKGVEALLGKGRMDESGDFTQGAGLSVEQIKPVMGFVEAGGGSRQNVCDVLKRLVGDSQEGLEGIDELNQINGLLNAAGFGEDRVVFDPSVVRGLGYYTGPVLEAELTFEVDDEEGGKTRFGSVAGGGRYDDLVSRFTGQAVPATGVSIGVDRLMAALIALDKVNLDEVAGPVMVLVLDRDRLADYQTMVTDLRKAGIRAELYMGGGTNLGKQLKYADQRRVPIAVIQGSNELENGMVTLKDLRLGANLSEQAETREDWVAAGQAAQIEIKRNDLIERIQTLLEK